MFVRVCLIVVVCFDWIIIGRVIIKRKNSGAKFDTVNKYSIQIWILISFICSYVSFITGACVCVDVCLRLCRMHSEQKPNGEKKNTTHNLWPSIYCSFVSFASTTIELNKEINNFFFFALSLHLLWGFVRWLNYERCFMW